MGKAPDASEAILAPKTPWHAMEVDDCIKELGLKSDLKSTGLSTNEAAARFEKHGANKMSEREKKTIWAKIWEQVGNVLVFILLVVAVISAIRAGTCPAGDPTDPNDPNNSCVVTK
jgi:magnesium-transporting ATPase (P-type)